MKLSHIIKDINVKNIYGTLDIEICDIIYDSRKVVKNSLFVCLVGSDNDGHDFVQDAINKGAGAVVTQSDVRLAGVTQIQVENTRSFLSGASANFFGHPARKLKTIALTGTKGKTSTCFMVKSILEAAGYNAGVIGTVGAMYSDKIFPLSNTTPESYEIHKYLSQMVEAGCSHAVLETSSIGLKTHRVDNILFDIGVFTNFSNDHIGGNEHSNMEEYLNCKSLLFQKCKLGLINADDAMAQNVIAGHTCDVKTFAVNNKANFMAENICLENSKNKFGVKFDVSGDLQAKNLFIPIPGKFNVYNALAAASVCFTLGVSEQDTIKGLKNVSIKGRLELIETDGDYTLIIDYAHNAVSMQSVLTTLREYNPKRLIALFGAGGNRPKSRRLEMGKASGKLADFSIITSDNPRFEDPLAIIEDIKEGINPTGGKYTVIPDRKEAIAYAINSAQSGDVILLAGKGHETYQEIKGVKYPMDERLIIQEILQARK